MESIDQTSAATAGAPPPAEEGAPMQRPYRGFWAETWLRFRRRRLAMVALGYVGFLVAVALLSPAIVGTKPLAVKYKGRIYFPAMGYFLERWENPVFLRDGFGYIYPENLKKNDPDSWAIWPLIYQDPFRRVRDDEWPGRPGNPAGNQGRPLVQYYLLRGVDAVLRTEHTQAAFPQPPQTNNWFGTTDSGHDVFARMVHGTKIALLVGFVATGIAAVIGVTIGALAGYLGGWIDIALSRLIEVVMCVPTLVLILALIAVLERTTIWHLMAVIGLTGWTGIARLTRGEFIKLRQGEYVLAARALGVTWPRIVFRHILPNALAPVLVPVAFGIASAILAESALSFLGFGAPPPNPSWGTVLNEGQKNLTLWWLTFFPGVAIFLTVLAYNLIGEALQEATDPRLREAGK